MYKLQKNPAICLIAAMFLMFAGCRESPKVVVEQKTADTNAEFADAQSHLPIHPWQKERVENIGAETTAQVVKNLANFDDVHLAETASGEITLRGTMYHSTFVVVRLFRVRRLLAEGRKNPQVVIPVLTDTYKKAHSEFLQARAQKMADMAGGKQTWSEPDSFDKVQAQLLGTTYLLAELQEHASLPLLAWGLKLQFKWCEELNWDGALGKSPVAIPMTLYAMHRLASTIPSEQITPEAKTAHVAYMEWANKHLPPLRDMHGTAWNADYDESDPLRRIVDPEGKVLTGQPIIRLAVYPTRFTDGTFFEPSLPTDYPERTKEWAELLLRFVEAAYDEIHQ